MHDYILLLTFIGIASFSMAWLPAVTKHTGISYSIIYVAAGALFYFFFPDVLPVPRPELNEKITMHLTEMVIIISLMGTGIKIDRSFSFKNWSSPIKLISVAMLLGIAFAAFMGYIYLGLDLASALLLGSVLAPTDPVLAADVQVGPPNGKRRSETRFALTAEAGLNDGMAFPFVLLAITLMIYGAGSSNAGLLTWFGYNFLYKIIAGIAMGYLLGKAAGFLVFRVSEKYHFLKPRDGFLAISLTLLVYGGTELIHGYGFVAVFVSATALRNFEKNNGYYGDLHAFTDQIERLLVAVLLIFFGGSLVSGILDALTWKMVLFVLIFLLIIRPVTAYSSLFSAKFHYKEKIAISFFGIRGMGSIFYLAYAFSITHFNYEKELWAIIAFTILLSVVIHGLTATPVMKYLNKEMTVEKIPE